MRAIQKGSEPTSLTKYRSSGNNQFTPEYGAFNGVQDLREALAREQGAICCYCLQRIRSTQIEMKVEHWHCQRDYPSEQLEYNNLLGACCGGEGRPWRQQHCDTRKGHSVLSKNPANPAHRIESFINYINGRIESADINFDRELNEVLNLNLELIQSNRKAVLDGFLQSLPRMGELSAERLQKWIADWNGEGGGERRPYCHIVVFWLRKKLNKVAR